VAFKIAWSESALASLSEAIEYIAKDSPSYAATLTVQADRAAVSLREHSHRGRAVPEYADSSVPVGLIVIGLRPSPGRFLDECCEIARGVHFGRRA
jgi:plasmid stabilization system protein ParE